MRSRVDFEKLQRRYQNISRDELESRWGSAYDEANIIADINWLNDHREKLKKRGREHVVSVPLVQVLSVDVKLDDNKPLAIYGRIYGKYGHISKGDERVAHRVYNRRCDEPETISQSGSLTLCGPDGSSIYKARVCMPLHKTTIVVDLWDAARQAVFSKASFMVEEIDENENEQVKVKVVPGMAGSVVVRYIAMPFAALYQVFIKAFDRGYKKKPKRHVNVNGKVAIRYDNTYGNYSSEEYTIYECPNCEFHPLEVDTEKRLSLNRYWIAVPAYSSVVVDCDLWDFDSKRPIVKETLKFPTHPPFGYRRVFKVDDVVIDLALVDYKVYSREEWKEEESDQESADMCCDESSSSSFDFDESSSSSFDFDESSSSISSSPSSSSSAISTPRTLRPHRVSLRTSSLVEVFSVFIGREKCRPLRLFGVIEALSGGHIFDIFRRDENNAVELLENENFLPILEGNGKYDGFWHSLKIMFDLKDVYGRAFIKGYVKWPKDQLDYPWWEKQLCSVIPGEHGFAAVHYSFFPLAVYASIEVFCKISSTCCNVSPLLIYGTLVAQYYNCDYSSRYRRDCYRKVLFKRNYQDPLQVPSDMKLPLDRSLVVVPREATLVIEVHLWSVGLSTCLLWHVFEIEFGSPSVSIDKEEFSLNINLKWSRER